MRIGMKAIMTDSAVRAQFRSLSCGIYLLERKIGSWKAEPEYKLVREGAISLNGNYRTVSPVTCDRLNSVTCWL